jgi:hypothetical protein
VEQSLHKCRGIKPGSLNLAKHGLADPLQLGQWRIELIGRLQGQMPQAPSSCGGGLLIELDEANRSSMNHRCALVMLSWMSSRKSLAPTSRPKERQSPCSETLCVRANPPEGSAASKRPVFTKSRLQGSNALVSICPACWSLDQSSSGDVASDGLTPVFCFRSG